MYTQPLPLDWHSHLPMFLHQPEKCQRLLSATMVAWMVAAVATTVVDPETGCMSPATSPNVIVARPGRNVTLPCLEGATENTTLTQWRFKGQNLSSFSAGQVLVGTDLFLPSAHFNSSGSYSCYAGGTLLRTWHLVVEEPPESPDFTCRKKSLTKDILCEWEVPRPVSLQIKARLWSRKWITEKNWTEQRCRYYTKSQKFTCRILGLDSEDDLWVEVTVCIANLAGAASKQKHLRTDALLKPDPPGDVAVYPVENATRKLRVTWRYPYSWGSTFYRLQFQLRYRAESSKAYSELHLQDSVSSCAISDALQGLPHTIQVRCREQFNHGTWSEWSRESTGTPWTELEDPEPETTSYFPKFPYDYDFDHTEKPTTPAISKKKEFPGGDPTLASLHVVLIMVVSATVGLALIALIIAWYKKRWAPSSPGERKPSLGPMYALAPLSLESPLSASPLLSPPASPISESSVDSPRVLDNGPYDVTNADYFLLPK